MSQVFVLDTTKRPLNPVHPGRARLLLKQGKAAVYRRYPFTIILKRAVEHPALEALRVKVDPGSQTTGLAVVNDASGEVVWAALLTHRGKQIKRDLQSRRAVRRSRRQRKTRYHKPRFDNRRKKKGMLAGQDIRVFLADDPERLARILAQVKTPLMDAAAVNATRWALHDRLDAACVGASTPEHLDVGGVVPLHIRATGHGSRQMCRMDRYGFSRTGPKQAKRVKGFQTGDLVRAVVPKGTKQGRYVGRVAVRTSGSFNITTQHRTVQGTSHRFCTFIARSDGYSYQQGKERVLSPADLSADGSPHPGF
jgi:hypothetical protein